jgi:hypothetical protein
VARRTGLCATSLAAYCAAALTFIKERPPRTELASAGCPTRVLTTGWALGGPCPQVEPVTSAWIAVDVSIPETSVDGRSRSDSRLRAAPFKRRTPDALPGASGRDMDFVFGCRGRAIALRTTWRVVNTRAKRDVFAFRPAPTAQHAPIDETLFEGRTRWDRRDG